MSTFCEPAKLQEDILPTELDIYKHYLYLNNVKGPVGDWKQNTPMIVKVRSVRDEVGEIWDRSGIPHDCLGRTGEKRIMNLVTRCKAMNKVAMDRRVEGFCKELDTLFDSAIFHTFHFKGTDPLGCFFDNRDLNDTK